MNVTSVFNDGKVNWNTQQPMRLPNVADYIKVAETLRPELNKFVEEIQKQTGIKLEITPPCVKSKHSATRKLGDYTVNSDPRKINDYLRGAGDITAKNKEQTIEQTKALIKFAQQSELVTGYNNEISFPDEETGMRSLKLHIRVQDDNNLMDAEFLIGHKGMEKAYEATKALRSFERDFRRASCVLDGKSVQKASRGSIVAREARHIIHNEAAERIGWNDLINSNVAHLHKGRESDISIDGVLGGTQIAKTVSTYKNQLT